jgi:hypothetical protein
VSQCEEAGVSPALLVVVHLRSAAASNLTAALASKRQRRERFGLKRVLPVMRTRSLLAQRERLR